jgi:hypothetical protein
MKSFFICAIGVLSLFVISCQKDNVTQTTTSASDTTHKLKSGIYYAEGTDWSGKVHTYIAYSYTSGLLTQAWTASVPQDYVLIGGGAWAKYVDGQMGALLTASYPDENYLDWHAESMEHLAASKYGHTLYVYAIGLKLDGVTRDQLKNYIHISHSTSGTAEEPNASASVGSGYTLIGGGAYVNNTYGSGNLLTACYPSGNSWYAASKDHGVVSANEITAYAIGIIPTIPNFGTLEIGNESSNQNISSGKGTTSVSIDNGWLLSCPGGQATWTPGTAGRMLVGIVPTSALGVTVTSKDHGSYSSGSTYAYGIKIRLKQ